MTMQISKTQIVGVLLTSIFALQPANAGFANDDFVTMGSKSIFQMSEAYGYTGQHRAWMAQDALDNALVLANDRTPAAVTVSRENGAVVIVLDGHRIVTVDGNSAEKSSMTVDALAQRWAKSIQEFLADTTQTASYVSSLKHDQQIAAVVGRIERTMYAPSGMTFQIKLSNAIDSNTFKAGDSVEGTVNVDVPLGSYVIPAGSLITGTVTENGEDNFGFKFQTIRTASGRVYPMESVVINDIAFASLGAHRVCTYAIPSGMANGFPLVAGRIPAGIGVGTKESEELNILVFHRNTANSMLAGKVLLLQLESPAAVAVLMRPKLL